MPPAFAHGLQPVAAAARCKRVQQRGHQPGAGGAERVAERDGAAARVEPLEVGSSLARPGERDGGEGLVDLEQSMSPIVRPVRARILPVAGIGAVSIVIGSSPRTTMVDDARPGNQAELFALAARTSNSAAAPSEICEELPAVMRPLCGKALPSVSDEGRFNCQAFGRGLGRMVSSVPSSCVASAPSSLPGRSLLEGRRRRAAASRASPPSTHRARRGRGPTCGDQLGRDALGHPCA